MVTSSGGNGSSNSDAPTTRLLAGNKRPTSSSWASSRRKELNRNQLMEWRNLLMLRPTNQDTNAVSEWLAKIAAVSGAHVPNFSYKVSQPSSDAKSSQGSSDAKSSSSSGCNSSDEAVASSDDDFSISSSVFSSEKQPAKKRSADSSFCSSDSSESYPHRNTTFMGPSQSVLSIDNGSGMEDSVETSSDE